MKAQLYDKNMQPTEQLDLNPKIFEVQPELGLIEEAVRIQQANSRKVIAHTKTRGEVSGGGKKPWKQKGTGRARAGSNRSPIWRHGGITFGPRNERNYSLKINKKQWRKALYMALSDKAAADNFFVLSEISVNQPKTKEMLEFIKNLREKIAKAKNAKKFLFVLPAKNQAIERAARNLKQVKVVYANNLNILDILKYDLVVAPKHSLEVIEKTYLK